MMRHYVVLFNRAFCTVNSSTSELTQEMVTKLERLSALRMELPRERCNLEEDIQLAEHIFEVATENTSPLYNVVEDCITCPLREDLPEQTSIDETLFNARKTFEGFFVSPSVGLIDKQQGKEKTDK